MPRSIPALINPSMLAWARAQAGYSLMSAALKIEVDEATLSSWESEIGEDRPSVAKARTIANLYRRPLALFYLKEPPTTYDVLKDFRRLPGTFKHEESPTLLWKIRQARYRRQIALDLMQMTGEQPSLFTHKATLDSDTTDLGERIRNLLRVSVEEQIRFTTAYEAFNRWREAVEEIGIFVFQVSHIKLEEMRALCLPENPQPVILLNSGDHPYGRIFSLLHELTHLHLVRGGVIGEEFEKREKPENQEIEVFANAVTANALLPASNILSDPIVKQEGINSEWQDDILKKLSQKYSIGREVILRRLVTLGLASEMLYSERRARWQREKKEKKDSSGQPPRHVQVLSQVGRPFGRLVLESYRRGNITLNDVSTYFEMKPKWLPDFERHLAGYATSRVTSE